MARIPSTTWDGSSVIFISRAEDRAISVKRSEPSCLMKPDMRVSGSEKMETTASVPKNCGTSTMSLRILVRRFSAPMLSAIIPLTFPSGPIRAEAMATSFFAEILETAGGDTTVRSMDDLLSVTRYLK